MASGEDFTFPEIPDRLVVHPLGENGDMEILPASEDSIPNTSRLPCGLPPILPDMKTKLKSFLTNIDDLPIFHLDKVQRLITREPDISSMFSIKLCPLQTTLTVKRDKTTGRLIGFSEEVKSFDQGTSKASTSMQRAPGPPQAGIKGSSSGFPFWPGGMDNPLDISVPQEEITTSLFEGELLSTPPGFKNGMQFEKKSSKLEIRSIVPSKIYLNDILSMEELIDLLPFKESEDPPESEIKLELPVAQTDAEKEENTEMDSILNTKELPVLNISQLLGNKVKKPNVHYDWAVEVDVSQPIDDFHQRIPDMAYKWPFELDTFQKQAILHLEKRESVFVAAHTSAGKTVVAEYAIGLAKKHMTRVIYTSPIKALSNQKFRDFKTTFEDVGLVTGDVQINQSAFCLIMTTEILRSMLYHGSDVVRELEWVIFDEVHYINDAERGVVWEEVLIMLPSHVNIILLSATVPNTMEFADWLGRIKKRKIYVVSTLKRPVPLEYYLYTGSVGKTQSDRFLIVNSDGEFLIQGYKKALESKKEKESKFKKSTGPIGGRQNVLPQKEKNIYIGLIKHLETNKLLPVVCFTLSRKRCDEHARMLTSTDLCTQKEKSEIIVFVDRSISKLKVEDRNLPQVTGMKEILTRGYGVHHSGILPILKEVVEMLFQRGLVKVLFATETFAMGVNMPARTVVFDTIRKHDGKTFRDLEPSEFIQMAGRAGRRGLDKTGTDIILVKGDVPEMSCLHRMILGKPQKLVSQFRLTYSMILNLLKVKSFRVEDVMKRSFGESFTQQQQSKYKDMLQQSTSKLSTLPKTDCSLCTADLHQYCKTLSSLKDFKKTLMPKICLLAFSSKILSPGRVLVVSTEYHQNVPAILLSTEKEDKCKVLLIAPKDDPDGGNTPNLPEMDKTKVKKTSITPWSNSIFFPNESKLLVSTITYPQVQLIANKTMRIDGDKIVKDWRRMEFSQYANCTPGPSTSAAFQELIAYCETRLDGLPPVSMNFKDLELTEEFLKLEQLENTMQSFTCTQCPLFEQHFSEAMIIITIQEDIQKFKYLTSEESLTLHTDFEKRKQVLKNLGYIDTNENSQLKGSVAREMSNHELLTTELLVRNVFGFCPPEEIAALLSCMVFQQRQDDSKLELPPNLNKKVLEVKEIAEDIAEEQKRCGINEPDFVEQYNFYLVNVVYEWAKGTPFYEIMELTDIQEGIIVRCIQRLSELLKEVRNGANLVSDLLLAKKMEDASRLIKRDIVFAASLYTQ